MPALCVCLCGEQQQQERMSPRVADAMRRIDRAVFIPNIRDTKVDYYFGLHTTDNPAYLVRCCVQQYQPRRSSSSPSCVKSFADCCASAGRARSHRKPADHLRAAYACHCPGAAS